MNRTPPASVRRKLRREVGFGCPVEGCGNPYLTWHHFDPPWEERQHHNPDGMIALCQEHHKKADHGSFTKDQLRQLKRASKRQRVTGRLDWMSNQLILDMGSNLFFRSTVAAQVDEEPVVWFNRDPNGFMLLNVTMSFDPTEERLEIRDNFFIKKGNPTDLECPPSGRKLKVQYDNGDYLDLEFFVISTAADYAARYSRADPAYLEQPLSDVNEGFAPRDKIQQPFTLVSIKFRLAEFAFAVLTDCLDVDTRRFSGCVFGRGVGVGYDKTTRAVSIKPLGQSRTGKPRRA